MNSQRFSFWSLNAIYVLLVLATVGGCERTPITAGDRAQKSYRDGHWNESIAACNEILGQNPDDFAALQLRGKAYLALQEFEKSINDFCRVVELNPADHEVYYYRSMAYEGMGEQALAATDRAKGRELDPLRRSAYAYDPSNFIPQSPPIKPPPRPENQPAAEQPHAAEDSSLSSPDASVVGNDDFQPDASLTRPTAVLGHDEAYVRDAVDDFRRMISETESMIGSKKKKPKSDPQRVLSTLPDIGVDPNDLLGDDQPGSDDITKKKPEAPKSDAPAAKPTQPALSTALPPGFAPMGGLPPMQSPYATTNRTGSLPSTTASPYASPTGIVPLPTTPVPVVTYGLPPISGTTGQMIMQPNTIHAPGTKPVLSTSLPTGNLPRGVPGVLSPPPAATPYSELPPMLPPPVPRNDLP